MCGAALGTSVYKAVFSEKKPSEYQVQVSEDPEKM